MKLVNKVATMTSNGVLSKGWYELNGEKYLIKGNTENALEPYSEVMASRIGNLLGLPTVDYQLVQAEDFPEIKAFNIEHLSICKSYMTGEVVQTISVCKYLDAYYGKKVQDYWNAYQRSNLDKNFLYRLLVFDAFIGNEDRHLNNWEVYQDIYGNVKDSPIIDNGASLLYNKSLKELRKDWTLGPDKSKPFKKFHSEQFKLVKSNLNTQLFTHVPSQVMMDYIEYRNSDVFEILGEERSLPIMKYLNNRYNYLEEVMG